MRPLIQKSTTLDSPTSATRNRRCGRDLNDGGEHSGSPRGLPGTVEWVRTTAEARGGQLEDWCGSGTSRSMATSCSSASDQNCSGEFLAANLER